MPEMKLVIGDLEALINISKDGLSIETDRSASYREMHFLSAYVFLYQGDYARGIVPDLDHVLNRTFKLFGTYHGTDYPSRLKSFGELSLFEFNELIKYYDGRSGPLGP